MDETMICPICGGTIVIDHVFGTGNCDTCDAYYNGLEVIDNDK